MKQNESLFPLRLSLSEKSILAPSWLGPGSDFRHGHMAVFGLQNLKSLQNVRCKKLVVSHPKPKSQNNTWNLQDPLIFLRETPPWSPPAAVMYQTHNPNEWVLDRVRWSSKNGSAWRVLTHQVFPHWGNSDGTPGLPLFPHKYTSYQYCLST